MEKGVKVSKNSDKSVKVNISMKRELLDRVDAVVEEVGFTRSGFVAMVVKKYLDECNDQISLDDVMRA